MRKGPVEAAPEFAPDIRRILWQGALFLEPNPQRFHQAVVDICRNASGKELRDDFGGGLILPDGFQRMFKEKPWKKTMGFIPDTCLEKSILSCAVIKFPLNQLREIQANGLIDNIGWEI